MVMLCDRIFVPQVLARTQELLCDDNVRVHQGQEKINERMLKGCSLKISWSQEVVIPPDPVEISREITPLYILPPPSPSGLSWCKI